MEPSVGLNPKPMRAHIGHFYAVPHSSLPLVFASPNCLNPMPQSSSPMMILESESFAWTCRQVPLRQETFSKPVKPTKFACWLQLGEKGTVRLLMDECSLRYRHSKIAGMIATSEGLKPR
jgi:hypothetical protein